MAIYSFVDCVIVRKLTSEKDQSKIVRNSQKLGRFCTQEWVHTSPIFVTTLKRDNAGEGRVTRYFIILLCLCTVSPHAETYKGLTVEPEHKASFNRVAMFGDWIDVDSDGG